MVSWESTRLAASEDALLSGNRYTYEVHRIFSEAAEAAVMFKQLKSHRALTKTMALGLHCSKHPAGIPSSLPSFLPFYDFKIPSFFLNRKSSINSRLINIYSNFLNHSEYKSPHSLFLCFCFLMDTLYKRTRALFIHTLHIIQVPPVLVPNSEGVP